MNPKHLAQIQRQFLCTVPIRKIHWQVNNKKTLIDINHPKILYMCRKFITLLHKQQISVFIPSISVFLLEIAILLKQNHPLFFPENIQQEVLINLEWDEQKRLLDQTVNLPALVKYPLQPKYVVSFLRAIIDRLEKQSIDVHDDLYKQMCDAQAEEETDYSYKHYMPNSDTTAPSVILKESKNKISEGTTGLNIWESSMAMAELALSRKELFQGRNIVELGAGCGFGGIVIAKYCEPNKVTISDGDYTVLDLLEDNVSINFEFNERKSHYWNDRSGTIVSE